ncbi:MAG TPA: NAD-dependent epimerase/dehydratase family protein [Acidimicrobiia bacterium]|jgi:UDP-glucose 4-epimerase
MLVTGGAGFIGSHLVDALLAEGHVVVVLDDLSTGRRDNVHPDADLVVASVADIDAFAAAMSGTDTVFHLAALGAVSRSVADPVNTNRVNGEGTLNALLCARDAGVRRFVLASSSSVYGGADVLPIAETVPTRPRSPYAVSKLTAEWHTRVVGELFGLETVVLRYFNVFGPRQRPDAAYAAVIPRFAASLMHDEQPVIYGDGHQSRDFTFVGDVVAANLAAAAAPSDASGSVLNVAPGESHDLLELLDLLAGIIGNKVEPLFEPARPGDIVSSRADASAARAALGWCPRVDFAEGLARYVEWLRTGSTR